LFCHAASIGQLGGPRYYPDVVSNKPCTARAAQLARGAGLKGVRALLIRRENIAARSQVVHASDKLKAEWPGILQWMIDGCPAWQRDGLNPVSGLDESGRMDAVSLGWIVMMPNGNQPLILQKAGGLQGIFSYTAFAPARGVGAFVAINKFDVSAGLAMAGVINHMITELAPR